MRRVLTDHARAKHAAKRGGNVVKVPVDEDLDAAKETDVDLFALALALDELEKRNKREAQVVDLKFFAGFTIDEIAKQLDVSPATVKADWAAAKGFLFEQLSGSDG
jgi:RNA polymerase sigma factor (TIGR02999 family)